MMVELQDSKVADTAIHAGVRFEISPHPIMQLPSDYALALGHQETVTSLRDLVPILETLLAP